MSLYLRGKYSNETLKTLGWLESCCENLNELLKSYRHLQPDGEAFSEETIERIAQLEALYSRLAYHEEEISLIDQDVERIHREISYEVLECRAPIEEF